MDYASDVKNLFDLLIMYIEKIKGYFISNQFVQLLKYLFDCIPEEIRFIFLLSLLLFVLIGFIRLFRE